MDITFFSHQPFDTIKTNYIYRTHLLRLKQSKLPATFPTFGTHAIQSIKEIFIKHNTPLALHGAAIAHNSRAHLFLAPTTAGKTTLTSHLVARGFDYITDDCILLDWDNFTVYPNITPLHLREGSLNVLKRYDALPPSLEFIDDPAYPRYTYTPANCITGPLPLGTIYFIIRTEDENRLEEMSGTEKMKALLKSPIQEYPLNSDYLRTIARLSRFPCYRLFYNDMDYVAEVIRNG